MSSQPFIAYNGQILKAKQRFIDGLAPGSSGVGKIGVFETMRVCDGKTVLFSQHIRRMRRGLKLYGIKILFGQRKILSTIKKVLQKNHLRNGSVRVSVWRKNNQTQWAVVCRTLPKLKKGYRAIIAKQKRNPSAYSRIKSIDYGVFNRAYAQAKRQKADEALLLNRKKYLVEGSRTNIFGVKDNVLLTPPISSGCLDGITRKVGMALAKKEGMTVKEKNLRLNEFLESDEAFLTNSALQTMPLVAVNGKKMGNGKPGPVTKRLAANSHCPAE